MPSQPMRISTVTSKVPTSWDSQAKRELSTSSRDESNSQKTSPKHLHPQNFSPRPHPTQGGRKAKMRGRSGPSGRPILPRRAVEKVEQGVARCTKFARRIKLSNFVCATFRAKSKSGPAATSQAAVSQPRFWNAVASLAEPLKTSTKSPPESCGLQEGGPRGRNQDATTDDDLAPTGSLTARRVATPRRQVVRRESGSASWSPGER